MAFQSLLSPPRANGDNIDDGRIYHLSMIDRLYSTVDGNIDRKQALKVRKISDAD